MRTEFNTTTIYSFARPANTTAYASGDLVANSATAADVVPLSWEHVDGRAVRSAIMTKDDDDLTSANFRLHLFRRDPLLTAPQAGDNGAITGGLNTAISGYLGSMDFDMTGDPNLYNTAGNLAVGGPLLVQEIVIPADVGDRRTNQGRLYGLLEARAAYTPADGETFTVELFYIR